MVINISRILYFVSCFIQYTLLFVKLNWICYPQLATYGQRDTSSICITWMINTLSLSIFKIFFCFIQSIRTSNLYEKSVLFSSKVKMLSRVTHQYLIRLLFWLIHQYESNRIMVLLLKRNFETWLFNIILFLLTSGSRNKFQLQKWKKNVLCYFAEELLEPYLQFAEVRKFSVSLNQKR